MIFRWHGIAAFLLLYNNFTCAQNSLTGDGFGGRLWYAPYNYTVGSYSAYTVCGADRQLYGWGNNSKGQLGDNTKNSTSNPVKVLGMTDVRYYSTGYNMGAIKLDSSAWVWGNPFMPSPTKVLDSVKFLDAGALMCSFVKYDGTVWSVGLNNYGSFGIGVSSNLVEYSALQMNNIKTAVRVANGIYNNIVLLKNGTVMATGQNSMGGLGNGSSSTSSALNPTKVSGLSKIIDIKSNAFTNIALDSFGDVYAWGYGTYGCIGDTSFKTTYTPKKIIALKNIVAISGSNDGYHFMALDNQRNCFAWGNNGYGQLGDSSRNHANVPVLVAKNVVDIMAGETFSYLIKADGTLWASGGSNGSGSIWMNLSNSIRTVFTKIDPTIAPLNLCGLSASAGNYFYIQNSTCIYDSLKFIVAQNDSFKNYKWDFGDGSALGNSVKITHKYKDTGEYTVRLFSTHIRTGRKDTATRTIHIYEPDPYNRMFDKDTEMCGKPQFVITPKNYDEEYTYRWNDGLYSFSRIINYPGTYFLEVINQHGCAFKDTYSVISHPIPKALFKADIYSTCVNKKTGIKFKNLSTCSEPIVKCNWDFTETTLSTTDSVVYYKFKKANSYPVFLKVFTQFGCSNDTIDVFDILPAPIPLFTIRAIDSCLAANAFQIQNNTIKDTIENPRFKWYFSEGFILSNSNPKAPWTYTSPGKFYIDLIYTNNNKCTDTLRRYVSVYPQPKAQFTVKSSFCTSDSALFKNTSNALNFPAKWEWDFGDKSFESDSSPKHLFQNKGTYKVTLKVISAYGCSDSSNTSVKVYNPPLADFSVNDSVQCLINNRFQFQSLSKVDTGQLVLQKWSFDNTGQDTGANPAARIFSSAGVYQIKIHVTDIFGCVDSTIKAIEIKNGPLADFNINNSSQCENKQNFIFTYNPLTGNDTIQSIEWQLLTNRYPDQQQIQSTRLPLGKTAVKLILKTKYGCPGLTIKNVVVNPQPKANFSTANPSQCFRDHEFNLVNSSYISSGSILASHWQFGDNTEFKLTVPPPKKYNSPGRYQIQLAIISDSACTDTMLLPVVVNPDPIVDIGAVAPVCLGDVSVFKNKSSITSGTIKTLYWDMGDNSFATDSNPMHRYNQAGDYSVTLKATSDQGCITSATFNNHAKVNALPDVNFYYSVAEGNKNDNVFSFTNITKPTPVYSYWDFGQFGKAINDSFISLQDTATLRVKLFVIDKNGCKNEISKQIFVYGPLLLFFPNAFSPNENDLNEFFGPAGIIATQSFDFRIFNRWGEMVFKTDQQGIGWDGTYKQSPCQQDVYTYILKLKDFKGQRKTYQGTFTLIR